MIASFPLHHCMIIVRYGLFVYQMCFAHKRPRLGYGWLLPTKDGHGKQVATLDS